MVLSEAPNFHTKDWLGTEIALVLGDINVTDFIHKYNIC